MAPKIEDCTVAILSAGERTTTWCKLLLEQVFEPHTIFVLQEVPFWRAIERSYELGIRENRPYLVVIDADVLVYLAGVRQLVEFARQLAPGFFFLYGIVWDKLHHRFRSAGNKVIQTTHLPHALTLIEAAKPEIRPDTYIRKTMATQGHHYWREPILVGIHDYEQSYADLFRKGYLTGIKNRNKVDQFINNWPTDWQQDRDYQAIHAGIQQGLRHEGHFDLSPDAVTNEFEHWLQQQLGLEEKAPLQVEGMNIQSEVAKVLNPQRIAEFEHTVASNRKQFHTRSDQQSPQTAMGWLRQIKRKLIN